MAITKAKVFELVSKFAPAIATILVAGVVGFGGASWKAGHLDARVENIEKKLSAPEVSPDARFAKIDTRLGTFDTSVATLNERVASIQRDVGDIRTQLGEIRTLLYRQRAEQLGIKPIAVQQVGLGSGFHVQGVHQGARFDLSATFVGIRRGEVALMVNGRFGGTVFEQSIFSFPLRPGAFVQVVPGVYLTLLEPPRPDSNSVVLALGTRAKPDRG